MLRTLWAARRRKPSAEGEMERIMGTHVTAGCWGWGGEVTEASLGRRPDDDGGGGGGDPAEVDCGI